MTINHKQLYQETSSFINELWIDLSDDDGIDKFWKYINDFILNKGEDIGDEKYRDLDIIYEQTCKNISKWIFTDDRFVIEKFFIAKNMQKIKMEVESTKTRIIYTFIVPFIFIDKKDIFWS